MKNKEVKEVLKSDIKYPQTIYAIPVDYELYRDEDWESTSTDSLAVWDKLEDAEDNSGMDEGEAWIAVYELKEMVRVRKSVAVKDRVVRTS